MLIWVVVALTALVGAPATVVGATALIAVQPVIGTVALVAVALGRKFRTRRDTGCDEVSFLRDITAVVASGATLRAAVRDGDRSIVGESTRRLCDAGMPMSRVGESLRSSLPTNGDAFAAVMELSEQTGSSLVPTLFMLTDRARSTEAAQRRRRIATAQARFSAAVVGVAPLIVTVGLVAARGTPGDGGPMVVVPMVVGAGLQVAGVAVVVLLASRQA